MLILQIASGIILGFGGVCFLGDYFDTKSDLKSYKSLYEEYQDKYYKSENELYELRQNKRG